MLDHFVTGLIETITERVRQAGIRSLEDVRKWPERLAVFSRSRLRAARSKRVPDIKSSITAPLSSRRKPTRSRS